MTVVAMDVMHVYDIGFYLIDFPYQLACCISGIEAVIAENSRLKCLYLLVYRAPVSNIVFFSFGVAAIGVKNIILNAVFCQQLTYRVTYFTCAAPRAGEIYLYDLHIDLLSAALATPIYFLKTVALTTS